MDVSRFKQILEDPSIGGFDAVFTLINCRLDEVLRAISRLFRESVHDDLALLYFSGHGVRDAYGRLYLAVNSTHWDDLPSTAVEAGWLRERMNDSESRRQILILDCCHSGAFYEGARDALGSAVLTEQTFAPRGYGREVLTASTATQLAFEGDKLIGDATVQVGTFTHFLIEGLQSGEAGGENEVVTVQQLFDYAAPRVREADPRMLPQRWVDRQSSPLVLARNPAPKPKSKALPPEVAGKITDPDPITRQGGVWELARLAASDDLGLALTARQELQDRTRTERDRFVLSVLYEALERLKDGSSQYTAPGNPLIEELLQSEEKYKNDLDSSRHQIDSLERRLNEANKIKAKAHPEGKSAWSIGGPALVILLTGLSIFLVKIRFERDGAADIVVEANELAADLRRDLEQLQARLESQSAEFEARFQDKDQEILANRELVAKARAAVEKSTVYQELRPCLGRLVKLIEGNITVVWANRDPSDKRSLGQISRGQVCVTKAFSGNVYAEIQYNGQLGYIFSSNLDAP
jgi:hypothetical protein